MASTEIRTQSSVSARGVGITLLVFTLLTLLILMPIPLILGIATALFAHSFLNKWHWSALLVSGILGLALGGSSLLTNYFTWHAGLFGLGDDMARILGSTYSGGAFTALIVLTGTLAGASGLLRPVVMGLAEKEETLLDSQESVIPDDHSKIRQKLIRMPSMMSKIPNNKANKKKPAKQGDLLPVGRDKKGKPMYITAKQLSTHMFILGSTGSGKTETLKWLSGVLLDQGWDGTIIDLKEDTEKEGLRDFCRAYAYVHNRNYQEVALGDFEGAWWLNALAGMGADAAFNAIMALSEFDDQYHQNMNRKAAQQVIQMMFHAREISPEQFPLPSMYSIGMILQNLPSAKQYFAVIDAHEGPGTSQELYPAIRKPDKTITEEAASFGTRLTNLYDSQAGKKVLLPGTTRTELDITADGLAYMGLSVLEQPDTAKALSAAILQRIAVMTANISQGKQPKKRPRFIIVDEASSINREIARKLLQLARSADVRLIFATQSGEDWQTGGEDDWGTITQNTNIAWIMRQGSPSSAILAADYLGTDRTAKISQSVVDGELSGSGSVSADRDNLVDFEKLRQFEEGEFVLRVGKPYNMSWGQGLMRSEELDQYLADGRPKPTPNGWETT